LRRVRRMIRRSRQMIGGEPTVSPHPICSAENLLPRSIFLPMRQMSASDTNIEECPVARMRA